MSDIAGKRTVLICLRGANKGRQGHNEDKGLHFIFVFIVFLCLCRMDQDDPQVLFDQLVKTVESLSLISEQTFVKGKRNERKAKAN